MLRDSPKPEKIGMALYGMQVRKARPFSFFFLLFLSYPFFHSPLVFSLLFFSSDFAWKVEVNFCTFLIIFFVFCNIFDNLLSYFFFFYCIVFCHLLKILHCVLHHIKFRSKKQKLTWKKCNTCSHNTIY